MMSTDERPVILELKHASKRYPLDKQTPFIVGELLQRVLLRKIRTKRRAFWALKDFSLQIKKGDAVGIIGSNGAGKSTLLSLIAGSVFPTSGSVRVDGRIGALLELGAGFHPDLTGRENIYLNASLLGLSKDDIDSKFDDILAFSELQDFIDVQIRNYSSGMHVRLGFAVAAHIDPDIILIDEALAVGDQHFQEKCVDRILQFKSEGKTLIFVSHSMQLVTLLCNQAVWLQDGMLREAGSRHGIVEAYKAYSKASDGARHLQQA
jgi:ABC-type polysaccharide/polyol phosphate transport system ATPase subunit